MKTTAIALTLLLSASSTWSANTGIPSLEVSPFCQANPALPGCRSMGPDVANQVRPGGSNAVGDTVGTATGRFLSSGSDGATSARNEVLDQYFRPRADNDNETLEADAPRDGAAAGADTAAVTSGGGGTRVPPTASPAPTVVTAPSGAGTAPRPQTATVPDAPVVVTAQPTDAGDTSAAASGATAGATATAAASAAAAGADVTAAASAPADSDAPASPEIADQETLDDKFENFDAESCQWVEDMPRRIHEAPGCGRGRSTKICVGYVVCNRTEGEGKFIRASTCGENNCSDAVACTRDRHYWSSPAAENDQKYLGRDIRDLINGVSRQ